MPSYALSEKSDALIREKRLFPTEDSFQKKEALDSVFAKVTSMELI